MFPLLSDRVGLCLWIRLLFIVNRQNQKKQTQKKLEILITKNINSKHIHRLNCVSRFYGPEVASIDPFVHLSYYFVFYTLWSTDQTFGMHEIRRFVFFCFVIWPVLNLIIGWCWRLCDYSFNKVNVHDPMQMHRLNVSDLYSFILNAHTHRSSLFCSSSVALS